MGARQKSRCPGGVAIRNPAGDRIGGPMGGHGGPVGAHRGPWGPGLAQGPYGALGPTGQAQARAWAGLGLIETESNRHRAQNSPNVGISKRCWDQQLLWRQAWGPHGPQISLKVGISRRCWDQKPRRRQA